MVDLKKWKKTIIIVSLVIVIAGIISVTTFTARRDSSTATVRYTALSRMELVNSISVSGIVESANSQHVYSTLTYPVEEIYVRIGDKVAAGELLAKLDTASLELDIAQQRSVLENSQQTTLLDLQNKRLTYENLKNQYENRLHPELINAEATLKTAEVDLQTKMTTYENNKILFESGHISEQELIQSEINYLLAVTTYDKAVSSLEATRIISFMKRFMRQRSFSSRLTHFLKKPCRAGVFGA